MTVIDLPPEAAARGGAPDDAPVAGDGGGGAGSSPRFTSRFDWLREQFATRLWPSVVLFFVLASAATLRNSPGDYIGDNRFEQFFNPGRRLAKSFFMWDGSRGLGRVREDFWPGTTVPLAIVRGFGVSPWLTQRFFHALCITMAGVGMVAVVRLFRPRIGLEHVLAASVVAFGAFSATFLVPSNLYFHYALAPWLLVVVYRGIQSAHPWRWAAMFALLTFLPGNVDTPGLIYNCVPILPAALFVVFVDRSVRLREVFAWFARAFVLSVWVNAVVLAKTMFASATLASRLNDTEAADVAAQTSSWSESLRGLGNWLSYFADANGLLKPQGTPFFTNWVVIVFTFVPPCVALFVLWQSRWRTRLLFALMMVTSAVVLVGGFPRTNPSPLGAQILNAYSNIRVLTAFRNTYKISAGLAIGVAALFAYGVVLIRRRIERRAPRWAFLPVAVAFLSLIVVAFPFWNGKLYEPSKTFSDVPAYWTDAFDYLDGLPTDGRSLVLPQTSRSRYRWGWVGDDIFDGLDARNHAVVTGVPLSAPIAANVLEAVSISAADPFYTPKTLGPMLRRLGLTEIVLRNDLDWEAMGRPRPQAFDGLRHDPDFERVASFGAPGENTTPANSVGGVADYERTLPPVEIYRLKAPTSGLRLQPNTAPLLVSGDGFAWPTLAQAGLLSGPQPSVFTGDVSAAQLTSDLQSGAPLLVTDTNRRKLRVLLSYEGDYSYTLSESQDLDRPAQNLWKGAGTQSVAWFPDAAGIVLSGNPRSIGGSQVWNRPANAFDGSEDTAWQIRRVDRPFEHKFHITLREPAELSRVQIKLPPSGQKGNGFTAAVLRFSDGTETQVDLSKGSFDETFDTPHRTQWIELDPKEISPNAVTLGIAEMTFTDRNRGDLDLREYVQTPDDVFRQADNDPALAAAIERGTLGYVFDRATQQTSLLQPSPALAGAATTDEETTLRRRFRSMGTHELAVAGTLRLKPSTPDAVVDAAVGGDHGAYGTERFNGALDGYGGYAVDGDPATAWIAPAESDQALTMRFPRQAVNQISFESRYGYGAAQITKAQVSVFDQAGRATTVDADVTVRTDAGPATAAECDLGNESLPKGCRRVAVATFKTPIDAERAEIRVKEVQTLANQIGAKMRIDEAKVNGATNTALDPTKSGTCRDLGVRVTLAGQSESTLRVRANGTFDELIHGRPVALSGCDPLALPAGWHLLDAGNGSPIDQLQLLPPGLVPALQAVPADPGTTLEVVSRSNTDITAHLENPARGTVVVFAQSWDPGWRAFVNGRPLGPPRAVDGLNGWVLEDPGSLDLELRYNPQRTVGLALLVTVTGLAACVLLIVRRPRRRRRGAGDGAEGHDG